MNSRLLILIEFRTSNLIGAEAASPACTSFRENRVFGCLICLNDQKREGRMLVSTLVHVLKAVNSYTASITHEMRRGRCSGLALNRKQPSWVTQTCSSVSATTACTAIRSDNENSRAAGHCRPALLSIKILVGLVSLEGIQPRLVSQAADYVFTALELDQSRSATRIPDVRLAFEACLTQPARHRHTAVIEIL